jgi:CheY-like chemotaxis protein
MAASIANDGHLINTAFNIAEALRKLRASPVPVVAFVDFQLPDGTSLDVLSTVEQEGETLRRHSYVMLTASPLDADRRALADRLGVATLMIPCLLGDVTWEITKKARGLQDMEAADQAEKDAHESPAGNEVAQR